MALGEQAQPEILHQVGVLVLVDEDVAEAAVILRQHLRMGAQDLGDMHQQIAEIAGVDGAQPVLIGGVEQAGIAAGEITVLGARHPLGRQAAVLPALDDPHQHRWREALDVEPRRLHHLLQQAQLVVGIEDVEAGGEADQLGIAPEHAGGERVEGAEPQPLRRLAQDRRDALAHFARGLVGEGHRQDLAREGAAGEQDMGEAGGQHAGLAGAGSGQHQQRAVDGFDGLTLFLVQAGEMFAHDSIQ